MAKIGADTKTVQEIKQNDDEFEFKLITDFRTTEHKFKLGEECDETTPDGRQVKVSETMLISRPIYHSAVGVGCRWSIV